MYTPAKLVPRHVTKLVEETLNDTPITVIQGARQVGKSTLVRQLTEQRDAVLLSLDDPGMLEAAQSDPDGFVRHAATRLLVIDELQRAPELIRAMKSVVDTNRRPGRFLVTGSADLLSLPGSSDSLAGRAETITLYGLSQGELAGKLDDFVSEILSGSDRTLTGFRSGFERGRLVEAVTAGSYPDAIGRSGRARERWFSNYVQRIVQRDASEVSRLQFMDRLGRMLKLIAANNAGELVSAHLSRDSNVPASSIEPYLQLLENLYLTHRLPAWGHNLTKRVVARQKVAVLDSGLAASLNGTTNESLQKPVGAQRLGGLLEGFVGAEFRKQQTWSESSYTLHHFRDRDLAEVDLVLETSAGDVIGIEVKASVTVTKQDFRSLEFLRQKLGSAFKAGVVLNTGSGAIPFGDRLWAAPVSIVWEASA